MNVIMRVIFMVMNTTWALAKIKPENKSHTYDFHIATIIYSSLCNFITNQDDQLPVGLLAQLVEHCTGTAEVMGLNPMQAFVFFQALFSLMLK